MNGRMVQIAGEDGIVPAWLSLPKSGHGPGLMLLQEIFGVNAHIRALAEDFSELGFVVLAPDLFWRLSPGIDLGYGAADVARALEFYAAFDVERGLEDIGHSIEWLRKRPACSGRIASIGYCLGGYLSFRCAMAHEVDAAVAYYGVDIERHLADTTALRCPVMVHYAGEDRFIPAETIAAITQRFGNGAGAEVFVYPGVDHAFVNRDREAFDDGAASLSTKRTLSLLRPLLENSGGREAVGATTGP